MDLSGAEHFELLADAEELKRQLNARAALAEHWQEPGEDVQLGGGHVSDDELPDLSTGRSARNLCRACRLSQRRSRFDKERSARVRQEDAAARPMEEGNAEIAFEYADLLTQRWLRDVKAPRGSTEVALFSHGDEVPEVPELHDRTISHSSRSMLAQSIGPPARALPTIDSVFREPGRC
jgi:hypothetical protein